MKYFTEEDAKKLALLPESEQAVFYRRFAEISMRVKIADDVWEQTRDELAKEIDKLVEDIHKRLDVLSKFNEYGGIGTEPYHPNRGDFVYAHAETNPKVQDRETTKTVSPAGKERKGGKR